MKKTNENSSKNGKAKNCGSKSNSESSKNCK